MNGGKRLQNKESIKTMDIILVIIGISAVVFTCVMIWLFVKFQSVPDSLIASVFAAMFGECSVMGWIKTSKEKYQKKHDSENTSEPNPNDTNVVG